MVFCKAFGKIGIYIKVISFSLIIKLILNLILIPIDGLYEKGAVISNLIYDAIIFIVIFYKTRKYLNLKFNISFDFLKITVSIIISILFTKFIMKNVKLNYNIKFVIEVAIVVIIYFITSIDYIHKIFIKNFMKKPTEPLKNQ